MREAIERLTVFERVLPYYRAHKDELRFGGAIVEGKQVYAWFARKGGLMVDTIDPAAGEAGPANARIAGPIR